MLTGVVLTACSLAFRFSPLLKTCTARECLAEGSWRARRATLPPETAHAARHLNKHFYFTLKLRFKIKKHLASEESGSSQLGLHTPLLRAPPPQTLLNIVPCVKPVAEPDCTFTLFQELRSEAVSSCSPHVPPRHHLVQPSGPAGNYFGVQLPGKSTL